MKLTATFFNSLLLLSISSGYSDSSTFLASRAKIAALEADVSASIRRGPRLGRLLSRMPLAFEPNAGQAPAGAEFLARTGAGTILLRRDGAVLQIPLSSETGGSAERLASPRTRATAQSVRMSLVGTSGASSVSGIDPLITKANYFTGRDPAAWRENVPTFSRASFIGVYPGVDMVYYGHEGNLEYDFVVSPGADPRTITLEFDGIESAKKSKENDLLLTLKEGRLLLHHPIAYQIIGADRRGVECGYHLLAPERSASSGASGVRVSFNLGVFDSRFPLVIDPVLTYSTYLGGTGMDQPAGIAADSDGNTFIAGFTRSLNFPLVNPIQSQIAGDSDIFISKVNAEGTAILSSTYIGGAGSDLATGIALGNDGSVFVSGITSSVDFPSVHAFQPALRGSSDAFVLKLDGGVSTLQFSTYFGGSGDEENSSVAADTSSGAVLAGSTKSADLPLLRPFQASSGGNVDGFIARFDIQGALVSSSYLGASGEDRCLGVALGGSDEVYLCGLTDSENFPATPGALQTTNAGQPDGFVAKVSSDGSGLVYSTYIGGAGSESVNAVTVSESGEAFITGATSSSDFPTTPDAYRRNFSGGNALNGDAFVAKLQADARGLKYSTYYGGSGGDSGNSIALGPFGIAYIIGATSSANLPMVRPLQSSNGGGLSDAFMVEMNPDGSEVLFSSYFGGSEFDYGTGIALAPSGDLLVAGFTLSPDFPVLNPIQPALSGFLSDGFVAKLSETISPGIDLAILKTHEGAFGAGIDGTYTLHVANVGSNSTRGAVVVTDVLPNALRFVAGEGTGWNVSVSGQTVTCVSNAVFGPGQASRITLTVAVGNSAIPKVTNTATVSTEEDSVGENNESADVANVLFVADLKISQTASPTPIPAGSSLTYSIVVLNQGPGLAIGPRMTATLPPEVTLVSATTQQGTCPPPFSGQPLFCQLFTLPAGSPASITVVVDVPLTAPPSLTNLAAVSSLLSIDQNPSDNNSSLTTQVLPGPKILSATLSGKTLFVSGENFAGGAVVEIDGLAKPTKNEPESPATLLSVKKAKPSIPKGRAVALTVLHPNGVRSAPFSFQR